ESGCSANDIVFSTSNDGVNWSSVVRVASDPIGSGVDHFIHGMGIDPKTSGSTAHLAVTYYFYPVANCGNSCTLYAGYTQSSDGGKTWTAGRQLSGGMQISWLPSTLSGYMVADYVATVFAGPGASCRRQCTQKAMAFLSPARNRRLVRRMTSLYQTSTLIFGRGSFTTRTT